MAVMSRPCFVLTFATRSVMLLAFPLCQPAATALRAPTLHAPLAIREQRPNPAHAPAPATLRRRGRGHAQPGSRLVLSRA